MAANKPPTRRGFLDLLLVLCSTVAGAAMAIPGLMYLWPAARGGSAETVEVDGADAMPVGTAKMVQIAGKAVIVIRAASGFTAFSASCTHLGCLVKWDAGKRELLCPCHAAVFDANGAVVSGPPPSPLPAYKVKEIGGRVYVSA